MKKFAANLKKNRVVLPEKTLRDVADAMGRLPPDKAVKYLAALDDFTSSFPSKELDGTRRLHCRLAKGQVGRSGAYLAAAKDLILQRNKGITDKAIEVLAGKAGRGSLDVEWLVDTDLYKNKKARELFNFMAEDPKTAWNLFRAAALDPKNDYLSRLTSAARARHRRRVLEPDSTQATQGSRVAHAGRHSEEDAQRAQGRRNRKGC